MRLEQYAQTNLAASALVLKIFPPRLVHVPYHFETSGDPYQLTPFVGTCNPLIDRLHCLHCVAEQKKQKTTGDKKTSL
jgi:hypothetical protein